MFAKRYDLTRFMPMFEEDGAGSGGEPTPPAEPPAEPLKDPAPPAEPPKEPKTYTEEELEKIISQRRGRWTKEYEQKIKDAQDEAEKLAKMNADEKVKYEKEKLEKEIEELRAEKSRHDMAAVAREMLAEKNITVSDDLIYRIITADAESTKDSVGEFIKVFQCEVDKAVKELTKGTTPKAGSGPVTPDPSTPSESISAKMAAHLDSIEK